MKKKNNPVYYKVAEMLMKDELKRIDEAIEKEGLNMPESIKKKLEEKHSLDLSKKDDKSIKIATCILLTAIVLGIWFNPYSVTAVRNNLRGIIFNNDNAAIEITLEELIPPDYIIELPEGFKLTDGIDSKNVQRFTYENLDGNYFQISFYADTYKLILDNEDFETEKSIALNDDLIGQMYVKNGISKIVFKTNGKLVEIQSNLPEEEVETISQTIHF